MLKKINAIFVSTAKPVNTNLWTGRGVQYYVIKLWLETGRWFSLFTPVSSTNKTDRHDITEILLKVVSKHHKTKPILYKLNSKYISDVEYYCLHTKWTSKVVNLKDSARGKPLKSWQLETKNRFSTHFQISCGCRPSDNLLSPHQKIFCKTSKDLCKV